MFSLLQTTNRVFDLIFTSQFDFLFFALILFGLFLVLIFDHSYYIGSSLWCFLSNLKLTTGFRLSVFSLALNALTLNLL